MPYHDERVFNTTETSVFQVHCTNNVLYHQGFTEHIPLLEKSLCIVEINVILNCAKIFQKFQFTVHTNPHTYHKGRISNIETAFTFQICIIALFSTVTTDE